MLWGYIYLGGFAVTLMGFQYMTGFDERVTYDVIHRTVGLSLLWPLFLAGVVLFGPILVVFGIPYWIGYYHRQRVRKRNATISFAAERKAHYTELLEKAKRD